MKEDSVKKGGRLITTEELDVENNHLITDYKDGTFRNSAEVL